MLNIETKKLLWIQKIKNSCLYTVFLYVMKRDDGNFTTWMTWYNRGNREYHGDTVVTVDWRAKRGAVPWCKRSHSIQRNTNVLTTSQRVWTVS